MSSRIVLGACVASVLCLASGAVHLAAAQPAAGEDAAQLDAKKAVSSMGWIEGTWSGEQWGGTFTAHYSAPTDGRILSYSRLYRDGALSYYEFEVFEAVGGAVTMSAFPSGKPAVGLTMSRQDPAAREIVFENPEKDFPTRITYHRTDDETLVITLDDPHGTSGKEEIFSLSRR